MRVLSTCTNIPVPKDGLVGSQDETLPQAPYERHSRATCFGGLPGYISLICSPIVGSMPPCAKFGRASCGDGHLYFIAGAMRQSEASSIRLRTFWDSGNGSQVQPKPSRAGSEPD